MNGLLVRVVKEFNENNNKVIVKCIIEGDIDILIKANEYLYKSGYVVGKFSVINGRVEGSMAEILRALFKNHREFYEFIGLNNYDRYHPNDCDFNENCWGFQDFMNEYFGIERWSELNEEQLETIKTIITKRIEEMLRKYEKLRNMKIEVKSEILFIPETKEEVKKEITLDELNMILRDAIIITNNNAFKISIIPIQQRTFAEIVNEASKTLKNIYEAQVNARVKVLEAEIQKLKEELERVKTEAFLEGLRTFEVLRRLGWQLKNGKLYYKKIVATHIKYKGRIYKLPQEYIDNEKFYVKGIIIDINKTVNIAKCSSAYHCNVDDEENTICLGDLEGKDLLTVCKKLPEVLKVLNLDSAYGNDAKEELETIVSDIISELEEGEEITEIWTI